MASVVVVVVVGGSRHSDPTYTQPSRKKSTSGQRRKKTPKKTLPQTQIRRRKKNKGSGWSRDCKDLEHKYFYLWEVWSKVPVEPKLKPPKKQRNKEGVCVTM